MAFQVPLKDLVGAYSHKMYKENLSISLVCFLLDSRLVAACIKTNEQNNVSTARTLLFSNKVTLQSQPLTQKSLTSLLSAYQI